MKCSFVSRDYKNLSVDNVNSSIKKYLPHLWGNSPDLLWESTYIKLADGICLTKTFNIKKDRPPYFSNEINIAISERESLFSKARKM